jgi:hypothetical protein
MSVMAARELTRADLDALPDDGLRHELIDGAFVITRLLGYVTRHSRSLWRGRSTRLSAEPGSRSSWPRLT